MSFAATAASLAITALAAGLPGGVALAAPAAPASSQQLCGFGSAPVGGGAYTVQNNEWGSTEPECITTDGTASFQVTSSQISNSTSGSPGGYPSIYAGCHWGACTSGGLGRIPQQVASLTPGKLTSSFATSLPGDGAWDVSYDIWVNQAPRTATQPNGTEIMIWLNHLGGVQPAGAIVSHSDTIDGLPFTVWYAHPGGVAGGVVSFVLNNPASSVSSLDIGQVVQDAARRGYTSALWYLVDVEAGFEIWQGGAGLAVTGFSVTIQTHSFTGPPPVTISPPFPPPSRPPAP
jgi:hypothetical protein